MSINQYDLNRKKNDKVKYRSNLKDCKTNITTTRCTRAEKSQ